MKTRLPLELTHIQNSGIDNTMRSVITGYATICACLPRLHYHQSLVLPTKLWLPPTKMAAIKINLTRPLRCCCSSASNSSMETSLQSSHDQATPSRRTPTPSQARPPILVENLKRNSESPKGLTLQSSRLSVLLKKLEELGIEGHNSMPGQHCSLLCPMCAGGDSGERSLSLRISEDGNSAVWLCFRGKCGWQGNTMAKADVRLSRGKLKRTIKAEKRELTEKSLGLEPLCDVLLSYFAERMITPETLRRNNVMKKSDGYQMVIAFTYWRSGVLVNCKYRDVKKKFWQETDTERIFYGLDDILHASDIIIVEGEMDKLAMEEAGFRNCVSVPDGAPSRVSDKDVPSPDQDTKYQYLWNCKQYFDKASRIILATDADAPGQALSEELARRLGRERCWRVKWPKKNAYEDLKDANEVLMYLGPEKLKETVENAEPYPISGLFTFRDYFNEIDAYYDRALGDELGVSTGWRSLDEYYNVVPGELTVVTGVPNSGKSEWIDALLCNLNESVGWKFALCSMENKVREHARKLLEKHIKKPFFNVRYAESLERMSREDLEHGKKWLDDTFHLIRCENDSLPNIKWVLDLAKAAVLRHGVRGLVIDPYNELDHQRLPSMTETEYVSQILTMIKRFAQHHSCHVWFVAHPRQLHNWVGGAPNLYDISGSAHFINKCDNGIVVHRNRDPEAGPMDLVQICVRKVRNKVAGTIGDASLSYNRITGEYTDPKT
ncbi:twinkle homolog protein, chloroplastic/mitochondrial-like isoform X1 [Amaranthus tricolor]|uniref:twinkle homolog protein, chloroplastic/mitochondrial-like isoform X1 n=1 Tax=Amaranthus tricolor TaxID=29722 RepID=UPI00258E9CD8|nr:twinkle homolog protein, chloroplastic/mitochondrial-like isoform X1 [Amaranthus tricolor]